MGNVSQYRTETNAILYYTILWLLKIKNIYIYTITRYVRNSTANQQRNNNIQIVVGNNDNKQYTGSRRDICNRASCVCVCDGHHFTTRVFYDAGLLSRIFVSLILIQATTLFR